MATLLRSMRVTTAAAVAFQISPYLRDIVLFVPAVVGVTVFIGLDGRVSNVTGLPLPSGEVRFLLSPKQPLYIVTDAAGGVTVGLLETDLTDGQVPYNGVKGILGRGSQWKGC